MFNTCKLCGKGHLITGYPPREECLNVIFGLRYSNFKSPKFKGPNALILRLPWGMLKYQIDQYVSTKSAENHGGTFFSLGFAKFRIACKAITSK